MELVVSDVTPEEKERSLSLARMNVPKRRMPFIPVLKLSNNMSKSGTKGEWFLEYEDGDEKKISELGKEVSVVILKKRTGYSFYSKKLDTLLAWTNELDYEYGESPKIYLVNNKGNSPYIEGIFDNQQFKEYKEKNYVDPNDGRKLLKYNAILYVYINHSLVDELVDTGVLHSKVARMYVSSGSETGIPQGEDYGNYKNPQPCSLVQFNSAVAKTAMGVYFCKECLLGSLQPEGKDFLLKTFEPGKDIVGEEFDSLHRIYIALMNHLRERFQADFLSLPLESEVRVNDNSDNEIRISNIISNDPEEGERIRVEDLPF